MIQNASSDESSSPSIDKSIFFCFFSFSSGLLFEDDMRDVKVFFLRRGDGGYGDRDRDRDRDRDFDCDCGCDRGRDRDRDGDRDCDRDCSNAGFGNGRDDDDDDDLDLGLMNEGLRGRERGDED